SLLRIALEPRFPVRDEAFLGGHGARLGRRAVSSARIPRTVTIDDVRALALTLPRSYEAFVRDRVKFRVGRIVYLAFSRDETMMGVRLPEGGTRGARRVRARQVPHAQAGRP